MVLVVGDGEVVSTKAVTLGPLVDGLRIVRTGLTAADRVVIAGALAAPVGAKVRAQTGTIDPETPPAESAPTLLSSQATFTKH
jgi:hypothetical protein